MIQTHQMAEFMGPGPSIGVDIAIPLDETGWLGIAIDVRASARGEISNRIDEVNVAQIVRRMPQAKDIQQALIIVARALCHIERLIYDAIIDEKCNIRL